jgi:hypothetical protein
VAVAAGAVWAWPDAEGDGGGGGGGGGEVEPPEPFRSAALYELGRHHFDASACREPLSQEDAPLAWTLPHIELLKCDGPGQSYTGTLMCTQDQADFMTVREAFLGKAADVPQPVTDAPAGRDEPWPFQVTFHHENGDRGRVFWDDPAARCSAEMQLPGTDLAVALDRFRTGLG